MMEQSRENSQLNKEQRSKTGKQKILLLAVSLGCLVFVTASFAWYTIASRTVNSQSAEVMAPYYLTLLNPGETDILNLTVGDLYPGETKHILFCVSNKNNTSEGMRMGGSDFNYSMQLVYTNNLALEYHLYELEKTEVEAAVNGEPNRTRELTGTDISSEQREKAGLTDEQKSSVNAGTYYSYEQNKAGESLNLTSAESDGYDSDYYLLEINWKSDEVSNFEKYDRETDVVYLLVQALQPEPTRATT